MWSKDIKSKNTNNAGTAGIDKETQKRKQPGYTLYRGQDRETQLQLIRAGRAITQRTM